MTTLRISLFGNIQVKEEQGILSKEIYLTPTVELLLAYLLLERNRMHSRDALAGLFWGDLSQERARSCLNTALWRLRRALERDGDRAGRYLLTNRSGEVGFNSQSDYWLDVAVFEERVEDVLEKPVERAEDRQVEALEEALALYRGDLLESVYEDWALREREYTRLRYLNALEYLMRYYRRHSAWEKSLDYALQILAVDPLREEIHREVMRLYVDLGRRSLAVQQFEICRARLARELGLEPMEETIALYRQIIGDQPALPPAGAGREKVSLQQVMRQLNLASNTFQLAQKQFQQAVGYMEQYTQSRR